MNKVRKAINEKKVLFTSISIFLIIAITLISAFAILSNTANKTNTLTIGSQTIEISEDKFNLSSDDIIVPNEPFNKNPTITNVGTTECFVRAYVGYSNTKLKDNILININDGWVLGDDGYYYYESPLAPDESAVLFNEVSVQNINEFNCDIYIYAESIDSAGKTYTEAWNSFNINPANTQ